MTKEKIDIVYLWVDGSDENWRTEKDKWYEKITGKTPIYHGAATKERWRDNGELLYSMRSVAECVPWVNHIYIITGFNQVPKWLNTKHPKITIVPHEEIMPHDALPTFNSNSIAMCIPNIKTLSEKFIIMNDDTFFNKHTKPSFFFDKKGRAIVLYNKHKHKRHDINKWLTQVDRYTHTIILSALKIKDVFGRTFLKYRPSHGIDPYIKSSMIECRNHPLIKSNIDEQILDKFRTRNALQMWIFELYAKMTNRATFRKARGYKASKHWVTDFFYDMIFLHSTRKSPVFCFDANISSKAILHAPIFCINDGPNNTPEILEQNIEFLRKRFPNKSQFEK